VTAKPRPIDYDELEKLAERERPKLIIGGGSAYPRIIDFARMRQIADKVGALYLVDMAHFAGLVAGGAHPSPVPHAHIVTTTTHKTLRGPARGHDSLPAGVRAAIDKASSPACRAGRWCTSSRPRRCASSRRCSRASRTTRADRGQRQGAGGDAGRREGFRIISGGTDTHLMLVDVFSKGMSRQRGREGARRGRHHGQQERDSVRHQSADEAERHSHRHAGADHARHEGSARWRRSLPGNFQSVALVEPDTTVKGYLELRSILKRLNCDLVHVPHLFWMPRYFSCPYVVTVHDVFDHMARTRGRSSLRRSLHFHLTSGC
jgi:hypothetical protein